MSHEHIDFDDLDRFARLVTAGPANAEDPQWIADYAAKLRFCQECTLRAREGNVMLLALELDSCEPIETSDQCLALEEMLDLAPDSPEAEHLRVCAACQLRYHEMLALSKLEARRLEQPSSTSAPHERSTERLLSVLTVPVRIAAEWAAVVVGLELVSGLLDTHDAEMVSEAVVREGRLKRARLKIDDQTKTLLVTSLPASCPPPRLRLRWGNQITAPHSTEQASATFDLSGPWQPGEHRLELFVIQY